MQRNSKAKRVIRAEVQLQQAVAIIDISAVPREKRKEDASKPLYLKRV